MIFQIDTKKKYLNSQLAYLDEWSGIERDHADSLSQAIRDLQTSILQIPVTGGARVCFSDKLLELTFIRKSLVNMISNLQGDIQTIKAAVCSAVDIMQAMGSSICHILSQVFFIVL